MKRVQSHLRRWLADRRNHQCAHCFARRCHCIEQRPLVGCENRNEALSTHLITARHLLRAQSQSKLTLGNRVAYACTAPLAYCSIDKSTCFAFCQAPECSELRRLILDKLVVVAVAFEYLHAAIVL